MFTWKKPIAIAFASAGVFVGTAFPTSVTGQTNSISQSVQQPVGSFVQDAIPFSTPYQGELQSNSPLFDTFTGNASKKQQTLSTQIQPLPLTSAPNFEVHSAGDDAPEKHVFQSTGLNPPLARTPSTSSSGIPTVIVRPPADELVAINDLTVDVERIAGRENNEFSVRLRVPESVKIIEVTPISNSGSPRNFKIQLEQQPSEQTTGSTASAFSMPNTVRAQSASSIISTFPQSQERTSKQPQMRQVEQEAPVRNGFKKNPFFNPEPEPTQKPPKVAVTRPSTPPIVAFQEIEMPSNDRQDVSRPEQASYNSTANATLQPVELTSSLSIDSALLGPHTMGLADIGDFMIYLNNPTSETVSNVSVRLDVPVGLNVVVLDRAAKVDRNAGTLAWQIDEIAPQQEVLIRYRVKSMAEGTQSQRVWVGTGSETGPVCEFETDVSVNHENSEAPTLPFESK